MFTAQDIIDNNITLFFPSECEWCSLVQADFYKAFRPTRSMSITHLHEEISITPPYVYFTNCDSDSIKQTIAAHIWYKNLLLNTDVQFDFDSNLGIPFISALEELWQRNFIETNNLKQEKTSD